MTHARQINYARPDPTRPTNAKGKYDNTHRRLTWGMVDTLRAEYRPHVLGHGIAALGKKYGLGRGLVRGVVLCLTWKGPRPVTITDVFPGQGRGAC